jgi:hypothetical protein
MKTVSENRMEAIIEVQTYNKMMPTFQKVANRKGLKEHSYKKSSRFQMEGSKLKSLMNVRSQTAQRSVRRSPSLLSKRNSCTNLVRST